MFHPFTIAATAAIDAFDVDAFAELLAKDSSFVFGNQPPIQGCDEVRQSLTFFFKSIKGSKHTTLATDLGRGNTKLFWEGECEYTRHDATTLTVPFLNVITL
jgi:hypothetical protein